MCCDGSRCNFLISKLGQKIWHSKGIKSLKNVLAFKLANVLLHLRFENDAGGCSRIVFPSFTPWCSCCCVLELFSIPKEPTLLLLVHDRKFTLTLSSLCSFGSDTKGVTTSQVLSRLGHMSYGVVGAQILQTGIPSSKANLIGATEISVASLAESLMLGVAIAANDASHFGFLAVLSLLSVVAASLIFCRLLRNPTDEQRRLFSFDPLAN